MDVQVVVEICNLKLHFIRLDLRNSFVRIVGKIGPSKYLKKH